MQVWADMAEVATRRVPGGSAMAEGPLHYAIDRAVRADAARVILVLHLSRLLPPGPQPHHRRIARAVMQDGGQAGSGQVFTRPGGDLLLVGDPDAAASLAETLIRLFRVDGPGADLLLSLWELPGDADAVADYIALPLAWPGTAMERRGSPAVITSASALVMAVPLAELVRRQTAVVLGAAGARPLYQELTFSSATLAARVGDADHTNDDPFLFRHLAAQLDARMLDALHAETSAGALGAGPPLHLNLTVPAVFSSAFKRLAAAAPGAGGRLGVELAAIEACADLPGFHRARAALQAAGIAVVLDGLSHAMLMLMEPDLLGTDLVKLDWAPRIATLPARERHALAAAVSRLGPDRLVLHRAETDAAIAWGRALGIRRFQGRQVDTMLAAARLTACPFSTGCSLRQCTDRAATIHAMGRAGCHDPARLDAAALSIPAAVPRALEDSSAGSGRREGLGPRPLLGDTPRPEPLPGGQGDAA